MFVGLEAWTFYAIFPQALIVNLIIDVIVVILSLIFNIISYKKYKKEVIAGLILSIESIFLLLLFSPLIVNSLDEVYWQAKTISKIQKEVSESSFEKIIKEASQYQYRKNGRLPNNYDEIKEFISSSNQYQCQNITLSSTKNKIKYKGESCTGYEYQGTIKGEIPLETIKNVSGKKLTVYAYKSESDYYIYSTKKIAQGSAYKLVGQHSFRCISNLCDVEKTDGFYKKAIGPTLIQVYDGLYKYVYDYKNGKTIYQLDNDSIATGYIINKNNQETGIVLENNYEKYGYYNIKNQKTIDLKYNGIYKGTADGKYIIESENDTVNLLDSSNGKKIISNVSQIFCTTNLCNISNKNNSGESASKAYDIKKGKYVLTDYSNIYDIQEDRIIAEKDGKIYELNSKKQIKNFSKMIANNRPIFDANSYSDIANTSPEMLVYLTMLNISANSQEPYNACYNKKFINDKIYELYDVNIGDIQELEKFIVIGDYYCDQLKGGYESVELISQKEYEESKLYIYEYKFEYPNYLNANSSGFIVTVKFKKVGNLYKLVSISRDEW